ncbi:hypothetical protein BGZ72_003912 [Mortierella alpina]|nr:hypothetical protein BGZ72_003912 [Mortierella alpina]
MTSPAPVAASTDSLGKKHIIYRGLTKKSMEYMSLAHTNKHPDAAHTLQGEILISDVGRSGYIQYCITLDQDWMTRRVVLTAMFDSGNEKRLVLEVDHDQRWYKVTEHRLVRSRSFFRGGMDSPARSSTFASSPRLSGLGRSNSSGMDTRDSSVKAGRTSSDSMQETDAHYFADDASCCSASSFSSSSSDLESTCSIQFEKINLTWSPPPKGSSKRGSKRFSTVNPLRDVAPALSAAGSAVSTLPLDFPSIPPNKSCATTSIPSSTTTATTTTTSTIECAATIATESSACRTQPFPPVPPPSTPNTALHEAYFPSSSGVPLTPSSARNNLGSLRSPVNEFHHRTLSKSSSSSSLAGSGPKSYEHLPALDGCIHLDLGGDISPSTLLFPLRRATLGIDPENMDEHLENLISCPSAVTSEMSVIVSFPDLELRPVRTHVAYVGQGSCASQSVVERWTDEDDDETDSTLVEVDVDGLVIQFGQEWARLNVC